MGRLKLTSIQSDGSGSIGDVMLLKAQEASLKEEIALKNFYQCVVVYNEYYNNGKSDDELALFIGTNKLTIRQMINIAKTFELDDNKFLEHYYTIAPAGWDKVNRSINNPKYKRHKTSFGHVLLRVRKEIRETVDSSPTEERTDRLKDFARLRDYIDGFVPKKVTTTSEEVKYYDCCACGAEATECGHKLKHDPYMAGMQYPVCDACVSAKAPIDYRKVANIYYILYSESEDVLIQHIHQMNANIK